MTEDFDWRLRRLRASVDADALVDLGCDLADAGRQEDAERCFRRAAEARRHHGLLQPRQRPRRPGAWTEAVDAYEAALAGGEADAWRNLGLVLEDLGDLAGAMRAYRGAVDAGDLEGGLQLAFLLREQGERRRRWTSPRRCAAGGHRRPPPSSPAGAGAPRWTRRSRPTCAPAPTTTRRRGPTSRTCCGRPAGAPRRGRCSSGAPSSARPVAWLPLGNFYADEMARRGGRRGGLPRRHRGR